MPTCSKDLSITINEPVAGDWWAFSEISGDRIGLINGIHIVPHGTAMQRVPGKVGDGVLMNAVNGSNFSFFNSALEPALAYDGNGLTAYGWIFFNAGNPAVQSFTFQYEFYNASAVRIGTLGLNFNSPTLTTFVLAGAYDEILTPLAPVNGTWLFFRAFYDPVAHQVGIQLNNGAITRGAAGAVVLPVSVTGKVAVINFKATGPLGTHSAIYDEVALLIDFHSDAEAAFVYNGGSGRTWPVVFP